MISLSLSLFILLDGQHAYYMRVTIKTIIRLSLVVYLSVQSIMPKVNWFIGEKLTLIQNIW